jgi:membrane-anchored protein YejM (alkaline phosphatase superfamily)
MQSFLTTPGLFSIIRSREAAAKMSRSRSPRRSARRRALALACAFLFAAAAACRGRARPTNIVLITLDTTRSDFVGAYHPGNARTPALDRLAAEGTLFENAQSLIPITLPSHASMFFSEAPHAIGNYNNGQAVMSDGARTALAEMFRRKGFATGAFVSLGVLASEFGLDGGFESYEDRFPADRWYLSADEVNARVFPWLEANGSRPFFLWVHYSDPHDPYAPPGTPEDMKIGLNGKPLGAFCLERGATITIRLDLEKGTNRLVFDIANPYPVETGRFAARLDALSFEPPGADAVPFRCPDGSVFRREDGVTFLRGRSEVEISSPDAPRSITLVLRGKLIVPVEGARDGYGREVEFMDGEIGKLLGELRKLGLYDRTAILAAGDHGEGLGEYRTAFGDPHIGHVHFLNPIYMKVPFIIRVPEARGKGVRRAETVTLLDVAPTLAGLAGFKIPASFRGRDLLDLAPGTKTEVFQETYRPEAVQDRFGILEGSNHLVFCPETGRYEYFDHGIDPDEKSALTFEDGFPAEALALKARLDAFVRDILRNKKDVAIDDKASEMLKSLGYVGDKK